VGVAPVRWGILSTAAINEKLLAGARRSSSVEVVAVGSRDGARAGAFAERHGIARAHGSYEALLEDPDVEAVYNPLPNALHHPWTMRALAAGKHVLCEKPYSRRPAEVEEAFDVAERAGLVLSEAYMYRYNPQIERLAELVHDGAIGELRTIASAFTHPCEDPADVRLSADLDGGGLMDVGCYCVSASRLLAGEPETVTAQQVVGPSGVDVRLTGTLAFAGGVLAHFDCGFHVPDRSQLEVVGSAGTLRVNDPWHCLDPGILLTRADGGVEAIAPALESSYRLELERVGDAVRGAGGPPPLGRADALGQARTIDALYRAAESGAAVRPAR
jgi:D-xylose 1-dehydrogenase (NADP+, D-xylono-1,5-lactone-forming)